MYALPSRETSPDGSVIESTVDRTAVDTSGVGLSNPELSHPRRQMLDLVNRLHSTGVQVDIDLPQIAVIGSQSAGKSSLIESISGITLPRAAGTCTRCPTECRLSCSDSRWQCLVSLRFTTDKNGQLLGQARNENFGPVIYDKEKVEERIRRAQRAILNPSTPRIHFLEGEDEDPQNSELSFSTNCISLQISGPDVADLSFCDLPGLIASVSSNSGHANDIGLVENLVTSYIKRPSCIILLTVACETDFENQGAHRLAKLHDPQGRRTIGVLTKPDRIPIGEESDWLRFIRNEREPLDNNWYCVKQPSSSDIKQKITWSDARRREDEFFSMTAPWSELDPTYQRYLRTSNLVDRLSSILSDLISKRLPVIHEELAKSIIKARDALGSLPSPPAADPVNAIAALLNKFTTDLRRHIEGVPDEDGLVQGIRPAQEKFRKAICASAPEFRPYERRYAGRRRLGPAEFLENEEGVKAQPVLATYYDSEEEYREVDGHASSDEEIDSASGARVVPPKYEHASVRVEEVFDDTEDAIYVDEVYARAQQARTRELPGNYPFVVQETYVTDIVKQWRQPALLYLETVHTIMQAHMKRLVAAHFAAFGQGILEQRIKTILHNHLGDCFNRAKDRIEWFTDLERYAFTLNTHYLADYRDKFFSYYKNEREKDIQGRISIQVAAFLRKSSTGKRSAQPLAENPEGRHTRKPRNSTLELEADVTAIEKVMNGLQEMGFLDVRPTDIAKLLPSDKMEPALNIMADVRAYFQVAYKRFVDNVPLAVDHEIVRGVEKNILTTINTHLGVNGPNGLRVSRDLAQESSQVANKRLELEKRLQRLEKAAGELMNIGL